MGVHQVRVGSAVLERLERVAHAAGHVDGLGRVDDARVDLAEALARAKVDPRPEHTARCHGDVLVPRLGVDAARHAALGIEADVVLHGAQVGQAQLQLLGALPVLLEPAAGIAVHRQVEHEHPGDVRALRLELLLEFERHLASPSLLALRLVLGLGRGLRGAPPSLVGAVPLDSLLQAFLEVVVRRAPAELSLQLRRVDGVATVVARAVPHPVEVVGILAHHLEDHAQHRDVVLLAVGADEVGLSHAALREDGPHGRRMVLGVNPVAHVLALAVELGAHAVDDVRDLARDELLHVLVGAVVVRAVRDRGTQAVGAGPSAHEHVGARLGRAVRATRAVRRLLGELRRVVERQVAVDLVGGDVVVADAVLADGLQQAEGALDVRAQERLRVGDGVVVVALGRVVHDRVVARHQPIEQPRVADVADDELHAVGGQPGDVLGVAGVGQLVQDGHVHVGVVVDHVVHEVAADEAAAARDDDVVGFEDLGHGVPPSTRAGC